MDPRHHHMPGTVEIDGTTTIIAPPRTSSILATTQYNTSGKSHTNPPRRAHRGAGSIDNPAYGAGRPSSSYEQQGQGLSGGQRGPSGYTIGGDGITSNPAYSAPLPSSSYEERGHGVSGGQRGSRGYAIRDDGITSNPAHGTPQSSSAYEERGYGPSGGQAPRSAYPAAHPAANWGGGGSGGGYSGIEADDFQSSPSYEERGHGPSEVRGLSGAQHGSSEEQAPQSAYSAANSGGGGSGGGYSGIEAYKEPSRKRWSLRGLTNKTKATEAKHNTGATTSHTRLRSSSNPHTALVPPGEGPPVAQRNSSETNTLTRRTRPEPERQDTRSSTWKSMARIR